MYLKILLAVASTTALTPFVAVAQTLPTTPPLNYNNSSDPNPGTDIAKLLDSYVTLQRRNPEAFVRNYQMVVDMTRNRTAAETLAAVRDDRATQIYNVLNGLGPLTNLYLTGAGASASSATRPNSLTPTTFATATLEDYNRDVNFLNSASAGATTFGNGTATPLARAVQLVNDLRFPGSTEPPKRTFARYQGENSAISPLDSRYQNYNALTNRTTLRASDTAGIVVPSFLSSFTTPAPYANTSEWVRGFTVTAERIAANGGNPITVPNVGSFSNGVFTPATFRVGEYVPGIGASVRPYRVSTDVAVPTQLRTVINATNPYNDGAYPSGHTNSAYMQAYGLAFLIPQQGQELLTRAADLGNSRILAGMHSPFDIMGGRIEASAIIATELYRRLYDANGQRVDWTNPANTAANSVYLAYRETQGYLASACNAASVTACITAARASGATASDPFGNPAANKAAYEARLTYGFAPVGPVAPLTAAQVPIQSQVFLLTRFPYLTDAQRIDILASTGLSSGYPILSGNTWDGWGQLNLYAAFDGYGAFANQVTVTMDAAQGGYAASDVWANNIAGAGGLTKNGSGMLMLTGTSRYTGPTVVNGGTLAVVGSITSPTTVNGGMLAVTGTTGAVTVANTGMLTGTGTTGAVTIAAGGTLAPGLGGVPGTLTVNGPLTLAGGATLLAPIVGTNATRVTVNGAATLGGNVNVAASTQAQPVTRVALITATGGVSGQFGTVATTAAATRAAVSYGSNDATLVLTRTDVNYVPLATGANQVAVASALNAALPAARSAAAAALLNNVFAAGQAGVAAGGAVLDRLGGESLAAGNAAALDAGEMFLTNVTREQRRMSLGTHLWGGPYGGRNRTDGETGLGTTNRRSSTYGGILGIGGEVVPGWQVGFAGGGAQTDYRLRGSAKSEIDSAHVAAYSTVSGGNAYVQAALAYGHYETTNNRTASDGVVSGVQRAKFDGAELRAKGEAGIRLPLGSYGLTPFVGVEYARLWTDAFQEQATASSGPALRAERQSISMFPVMIGARLDGSIGTLRPYIQADYRHEFRRNRTANLSFVELAGSGFTIAAARPAQSAFHAAAGAEVGLSARLSAYITADGTISDGYTAVNGNAGLRLVF
ncbi:autotransporter domain-containing protein [Sphingomonas montana]|uniref:autotransporter domain-containing protein n=1 Tax=Sphingomonas montana TaxID=1843236 RepID=UPI00096E70E6|nr:autotransporter domain-containing protein [Sphingomonas montana]